MKYRYIIRANGNKALPVLSDLNLDEFRDYIRKTSEYLHPEGTDTIWRWGLIEFINPVVMLVDDYANYLPAIIGVK